VKLIAKYDPVMREHLASVRLSDKPTTSNLSLEIQNEFIALMANHVRTEIIKEVKVAKYFAVMFDSTPDISHTDLFTQILHYVKIQDSSVEVNNRLLTSLFSMPKTLSPLLMLFCQRLLQTVWTFKTAGDRASTMPLQWQGNIQVCSAV